MGILESIDRRKCSVMMGQRSGNQDQLFYTFNLDDHIPKDHLLRGIDHFFDAGDLRKHMAPL